MIFNRDQILRIIRERPLSAVKLIALNGFELERSLVFASNWGLFDYLEALKPSNSFDFLIVASKNDVDLGDIKPFFDGMLLKRLAIIRHDEEKLPETIRFFYKSGPKIEEISSPFFLFKEPVPQKDEDSAVAFFLTDTPSSEIAENIKLAEDAGFPVSESYLISENSVKHGINGITSLLTQRMVKAKCVILFFAAAPAFISKLEHSLENVTVLSRDDMIISIFDSRANGSSGKLKIESIVVAKERSSFRQKITGLSRIKGGIGLKGPGETKEEERRRILKKREKSVREGLEKEFSRQEFQRKFRKKSNLKTVAIVGYTNAGKSTLFNALMNEHATDESDRFFSSIDPKIRKLNLFGMPVFLLDTVGFISEMSEDVIDTFNPTFSEISNSELILDVVDPTEKGWERRKSFVESLLVENGSKKENIFTLFSKKDRVRIKHPAGRGFYYNAFDGEDILRVKKFIFDRLNEENEQ